MKIREAAIVSQLRLKPTLWKFVPVIFSRHIYMKKNVTLFLSKYLISHVGGIEANG